MIRKIYLFLTAFIAFGFFAVAQNNPGSIKVLLVDEKKEAIPFANVVVYNGNTQVATGTTDIDGYAFIKQLSAGTYNVKAVYVGYQTKTTSGVIVNNDKTTYFTVAMTNAGGIQLEEVVVEYKAPLIDPDTKSGQTTDRVSFQAMADKSIAGVLSTAAGVYSNGTDLNLRGSRGSGAGAGADGSQGANNIFIDGERVIGTANVPRQAVQQMSVILGGIPAQYGDVSSGIISITTRGPQPKWFGGIEATSSGIPNANNKQLGTDKYGYNFLGFSFGGPLLNKKDSSGTKPIVGFFLGGEIEYQKDPRPWANGIATVNKDKLSKLEANPLQYNPLSNNYYLAASYVNSNDMGTSAVRQNVAQRGIRLNPKIDIAVNPNLNITLGGSWDYTTNHTFIYEYALLNSQHNPQVVQNTMRGYARLTQRFGPTGSTEQEKSQSVIKNAFWTAQASYQKYKFTQQDEQFKNNYFDYGYVGKFNEYQMPFYYYAPAVTASPSHGGAPANTGGYMYGGVIDTLITFTPGSTNALTANYTNQLMNDYNAQGIKVTSYNQIVQNNGLRNGDVPGNVHALWYNTGRPFGGYTLQDQSMIRFTSNFTADIKNHSIVLGVEFDRRDERGYSVQTRGLWSQMRSLANMHNSSVDTASLQYNAAGTNTVTVFSPNGSIIQDASLPVVTGSIKYDPSAQSVFSKNFYDQIGVDGDHSATSTKYINIDGVDPTKLNLGMFSPDELLNSGNALVSAYGYDYTGKRLNSTPSFNDFLNKFHTDKFGDNVHDRLIKAFTPIYMAGYIQDRFDFKDIKFNVGLRIDRYDANQMVLKDKYLLQDAYHVNELTGSNASYASEVPASVPKDAVIYVADNNSANKAIVGYRSGDNWYDASGNAVSDPKLIAGQSGGQAQPWLSNPTAAKTSPYSNSAFTPYVPQINVMPRVAFSFPISDVANFFAHYDILTERPVSYQNRMSPSDWYYLSSNVGGVLANPNLKPTRTIDYELGFSQLLNEKKSASLEISCFYREMRNLIQIVRVNQAYPLSYLTYGNVDFATVKGFSAAFKMRRTGGVQFSCNYTMQFAEGSGSNANGGYNLASSGQPNLRVIMPLDYDQRHTLAANFDYRFGAGKDYRGPQTIIGGKTYQWLENFGFNIVPRVGSGTPYTRRTPAAPDEEVGNNITQRIAGDLNGSRLPWQFRTDMRIDKNFQLTIGKANGDQKAKTTNLNIYFQILNLLNTKNIIAMHNYTGSPTDDGYLASNFGLNEINQKAVQGAAYAQAFVSQYNAKLNDGTYYSMPRQFRVGIQWDF